MNSNCSLEIFLNIYSVLGRWFCAWGVGNCNSSHGLIHAYCSWETSCGACQGYRGEEAIQCLFQTSCREDTPTSSWRYIEESCRSWEWREVECSTVLISYPPLNVLSSYIMNLINKTCLIIIGHLFISYQCWSFHAWISFFLAIHEMFARKVNSSIIREFQYI